MAAKPQKHRVGQSEINGSDLRGLKDAYRRGELLPCLGAGVSFAYGIPGWEPLVLELFLRTSGNLRALQKVSEPDRRALAAFLSGFYAYDPVVLSRAVKGELRRRAREANGGDGQAEFAALLRECLYARLTVPTGPTTLDALAALVAAAPTLLPELVTFNFDDLLEEALGKRKVANHPVHDARRDRRQGVRVVHAHGFVPRDPRLEPSALVFTEDEYHLLSSQSFHWAAVHLVHALRNKTALFVGLSMTDPNLRRLLDASRVRGERPAHWQVQLRRRIRPDQRERALELLSAAGGSADALDAAPALSERLDRELYESMGVKTIWLERWEDLPLLLGELARA